MAIKLTLLGSALLSFNFNSLIEAQLTFDYNNHCLGMLCYNKLNCFFLSIIAIG